MLRKSLVACLVFFVLAACVLEAQNVFALPGSASTALAAQVYSANPFSPITGVTTGPGAFLALAANGKFYIIQTSTSVAVTDSVFATVGSIGSFSQAPTGAVVPPTVSGSRSPPGQCTSSTPVPIRNSPRRGASA
jgi:hypothetical protein